MKQSFFNQDRKKANQTVARQSLVILALLIIVLVLLTYLLQSKDRFILIPPKLDSRVTLHYNSATQNYQKDFGTLISTLLGNMTPKSATSAVEMASAYFEPRIYLKIKDSLTSEAIALKKSNVSISFTPITKEFEPETGKVFVTGLMTENNPARKKPLERTVTYEYKINISDYQPQVVHFDFYQNGPRTIEYFHKTKNPLEG